MAARTRAPLPVSPAPTNSLDRVIAVVRYRDGSVIDVVHQVKGMPCACFPELAACHDVLALSCSPAGMRDKQDSVLANAPRHPLVSFCRGGAVPDERQRVNPPDLNHGVTALHTLAEEYGWTIGRLHPASASGPEGCCWRLTRPLRRAQT